MSLTDARVDAPRRRDASAAAYVAAAILFVVFTVPAMRAADEGPRTDLTVVNETSWDVDVELVLRSGGRVPLASVSAETTRTVDEVLAPGGGTWQLRWVHLGQEVGRTELSDDAMGRAGRRVEVPAEVARTLSAAGAQTRPWLPR